MAHLVFQTAFPGDLFLSVPLIKRLRAWDPATPITLACRRGLGEFFLRNKLVDEVIEVDKRAAGGRRQALSRLRAHTWDLVIVPHQSPRTAVWIAGLFAGRGKVGFAKWWNRPVFSKRVIRPDAYPDALRQLSLLAAVDDRLAEWFASDEVQALRNSESRDDLVDFRSLTIPPWASMRVLEPRGDRRVVFLAPGSVWETKRWLPEGFAAVARRLLAREYRVEIVGSPNEAEVCAEVARLAPGSVNTCGQGTLADLVDRFARGHALVSNDSGAAHAAAAAGLATVAVFGPTVLELGYRPWIERSIVVQNDLPCRPCGKHGHHKCPIGTHECMRGLGAARVLGALGLLLGESLV